MAAQDNAYQYIEENRRLRLVKNSEIQNQRKVKKDINKSRRLICLFCALVFIIGAAYFSEVYMKSQLTKTQLNLFNQKQYIKELKIDTESLATKIDKAVVLETVEKRAMEELNMQKAKPEQIQYIVQNYKYTLDSNGSNATVAMNK